MTPIIKRMPVLFIGHGNPMNAIEDNRFHRGWRELGRRLPKPTAILCVSAHWERRGLALTAAPFPETIHDFYGFPQALYEVRYPAPGSPSLARRVADLLKPNDVVLDTRRGLDHGAWSVLSVIYPAADIPAIQLSLDTTKPPRYHYQLAGLLEPLRDEGVLIVGSGNMVHHLGLFNFHDATPHPWASRCATALRKHLAGGNHDLLIHYDTLTDWRLAIPTPEHYLPLLYLLGLQKRDETLAFFNDEVISSVSMTSVVAGNG